MRTNSNYTHAANFAMGPEQIASRYIRAGRPELIAPDAPGFTILEWSLCDEDVVGKLYASLLHVGSFGGKTLITLRNIVQDQ
jgi:hypothetical protein